MAERLKPVKCGCGGEAEVGRGYIASSTPYMVYCTKCKIVTKDYTTEAEAIQAWNRAMGADVNSVVSVFSSEVKDE